MVLGFLIHLTFRLIEIFYVYGYGMYKTLDLIHRINKPVEEKPLATTSTADTDKVPLEKKEIESEDLQIEAMQLLVFWITLIILEIIYYWFSFIPGLDILKISVLSAKHSKKLAWNKKFFAKLFGPDQLFEKVIYNLKQRGKQMVSNVKKVE